MISRHWTRLIKRLKLIGFQLIFSLSTLVAFTGSAKAKASRYYRLESILFVRLLFFTSDLSIGSEIPRLQLSNSRQSALLSWSRPPLSCLQWHFIRAHPPHSFPIFAFSFYSPLTRPDSYFAFCVQCESIQLRVDAKQLELNPKYLVGSQSHGLWLSNFRLADSALLASNGSKRFEIIQSVRLFHTY